MTHLHICYHDTLFNMTHSRFVSEHALIHAYPAASVCLSHLTQTHRHIYYEAATVSKIDSIIGLFCRIEYSLLYKARFNYRSLLQNIVSDSAKRSIQL